MLRILSILATALGALSGFGGPAAAQERYPPATWDSYSNSSVNISVYLFRDINRNGVYDMGDRPMSGILVDAHGDRKTITTRSNKSGFANFAMSASDPEKDITFAGDYEFTVVPPPGWIITTANASQSASFELFPGAPADIITQQPPQPVGLAPHLYIAGRVAADVASITVVGPDGVQTSATPGPDRQFRIDATPGEWLVTAAGRPGTRRVVVEDVPVILPLLDLGSDGVPSISQAGRGGVAVGFDDLRSGSVFKVPNGYGGLNWDNFVMAHEKIYPVQGYRNNVTSGEFVAYNGSGHPSVISSQEPFDFTGAFIGLSNDRAEGETLHITAWRGADLAYAEDIRPSAFGPFYFAADFEAITRIEFRTEHYWQATFDDMTFEVMRSPGGT